MDTNPLRIIGSRIALFLGGLCLAVAAAGFTVERTAFDANVFGDRMAASLREPRVAAFVADRITSEVIKQDPDLTAVRPLILVTVRELLTFDAMAALVRKAATTAHEAVFAKGTHRVVLSVPDVGVLLRSALERANPEVAGLVPHEFSTEMISLGDGPVTRVMGGLWLLKDLLVALVWSLLVSGILLMAAGVALARDRRTGLVNAGVVLLAAGLAVVSLLPLGRLALAGSVSDSLVRGAAEGLWRVGLKGLLDWGIVFGGVGILLGAAGSSLIEDLALWDLARVGWRAVTTPPAGAPGRVGWSIGLIAVGGLTVWQPTMVLQAAAVLIGLGVALVGTRELFRVALRTASSHRTEAKLEGVPGAFVRASIAVVVLIGVTAVFLLTRKPTATPLPEGTGCNGYAALCDRPLDEVVLAGAHNAMSNAQIDDWMFPHHQHNIVNQLRDGIRAFLIDVHYGFPGASRIKTDLAGMRPKVEILEHAIGSQGMAAAMRIRETLVGADDGQRGLYLCHGFCELGAYELTPTLEEMRNFLVQRPEAVVVLVIEDYVTPEDLAAAFEESRLVDFVYQDSGSPWPTLGALVASGRRVVVFLESGNPGVPWLRPAFEHIQETPYTFHEPAEFSCRPNRGGTDGELFQINHWIETTPAPRPSNAEAVNAYPALMKRAGDCQQTRSALPNIIAVDFYDTGALFRVVDELNGVAFPD